MFSKQYLTNANGKIDEGSVSFGMPAMRDYLNLSKDLLGALRRRLPVTKQKFDWERAGTGGVAKLGKNLQEMAAK